MPSFDVVSKVEMHELNNAVDQAKRELTTRFDFKGVEASFELKENVVSIKAPSDFQVKQMDDMLVNKLTKRGIDSRSLDRKPMDTNLAQARQDIEVKQGISQDFAKKITKFLKESKLKVQAQIQGDQVRVTGKKRDDLQDAISMLQDTNEVDLPLQFENFRD